MASQYHRHHDSNNSYYDYQRREQYQYASIAHDPAVVRSGFADETLSGMSASVDDAYDPYDPYGSNDGSAPHWSPGPLSHTSSLATSVSWDQPATVNPAEIGGSFVPPLGPGMGLGMGPIWPELQASNSGNTSSDTNTTAQPARPARPDRQLPQGEPRLYFLTSTGKYYTVEQYQKMMDEADTDDVDTDDDTDSRTPAMRVAAATAPPPTMAPHARTAAGNNVAKAAPAPAKRKSRSKRS